MKSQIALILLGIFLSGCAVLHHAQVGQIDNRTDPNAVWIPFEILMNETGISTQEIGAIAKATNTNAGDRASELAKAVAFFQMGPRTGNPIYNEHYAEQLVYQIYEKCPSGQVTGLMSIRETRKYPVISGEIVKLTGFCKKNRKPASEEGET